jgi:transposase-like protein
VPPLRERLEDISALAEFFLRQHAPTAKFSDEALQVLLHYPWPGNVRELKNVIFKAAMHAKPGTQEIRASDLPASVCGAPEISTAAAFQGNLDDMEKQMIFQTLARTAGNQAKAAEQLGISSRTLRRKLAKYEKQQAGDGSSPALGTLSAPRQRYFRVTLEVPVILQVDGVRIEATSVNISSGGLAIKTPAPLSHGNPIEVSFNLPGASSPIEFQAKLAWAATEGLTGLSIVEIHPALQRELQQWLVDKAKTEGWAETQAAH